MALLTLNGFAVIRGDVRLPRVGVWSADLKIDAQTAFGVGGAVTLASADNAFFYAGTAYREGVYSATLTMRVIGGAGGLGPPPGGVGQNLPAKAYQGPGLTVGLVLTDILTTCGEKLSSTSDQSVLGMSLNRWTRTAGSGKRAIARLLDTIATSWRMLPNGQLWVGTDTYPAAPTTKFDLLERHWGEGRVIIGSQQPFVSPGTLLTMTVDGDTTSENVSNVVHSIHANSIRSEVWFERSGVQT